MHAVSVFVPAVWWYPLPLRVEQKPMPASQFACATNQPNDDGCRSVPNPPREQDKEQGHKETPPAPIEPHAVEEDRLVWKSREERSRR